jgi:hypothetical protein
MSIDNLQLLVKKRFLRSASLSHPHTPKAIPTERFAIAFQHLQTRFLRSASLSHSHIPTYPKAIPTERFAIALTTSPKSDSYGALRYRTPKIPNSDSYGALRYRTPNIPKSDRTPHPKTAIASHTSQKRSHPNIPNQRSHSPHIQTEIAPPTPLKQRSHSQHPKQRFLRSASLSHPQYPPKAIPTERFAIALPHPHIPKSDSYGALRYRTYHIPKKRFLRSASLSHSQHPQKRSHPTSQNSDSYGALRYRTPNIP